WYITCSTILILPACVPLLDLHSFPTRRSSDLPAGKADPVFPGRPDRRADRRHPLHRLSYLRIRKARPEKERELLLRPGAGDGPRSEEHTSELQSRFDLVCRLLLEKKNRNKCLL